MCAPQHRLRTRQTFRRRTTGLHLALYSAALSGIVPGFVAAQDDDAAVTAAARALAVEGFKLAQNDQCGDAIDKLERAEKLHPAPMVSARLGECYIKEGRLVEGVERLRAVLREPLPPNPSDALQQSYATSKALLDATRPKLATLTVSIEAPSGSEPNVTIDGHPIPVALLGARRPTDPGEHVITATATGYLTSTKRISLGPGEEASAVLSLIVDAGAARAQARAAAAAAISGEPTASGKSVSAPAPVEPRPTAESTMVPSYLAWGVGVVGVGVGVGFGAAAMHDKSTLDRVCPAKKCPGNERGLLDTAHTNATLSTVGYLTAIGGAALGTVFYFTFGRSSETELEHTAAKPGSVAARVGIGAADLSVTF